MSPPLNSWVFIFYFNRELVKQTGPRVKLMEEQQDLLKVSLEHCHRVSYIVIKVTDYKISNKFLIAVTYTQSDMVG